MHPPNDWPLADDRNVKTIVEYLADELINATKGSSTGRLPTLLQHLHQTMRKPIQVKNRLHLKINPTYSKTNREFPNHRLKVLRHQAQRSFNDYKITRHFEANKGEA